MTHRFDLFRKQDNHFIKWIGTAESLEDLDKLIQADLADQSEDNYVIVQSDYGLTHARTPVSVAKVVSEKELRISTLDCT